MRSRLFEFHNRCSDIVAFRGKKSNSTFYRASFGPLSTNGGLTISLGTHPTMFYVPSCEGRVHSIVVNLNTKELGQ